MLPPARFWFWRPGVTGALLQTCTPLGQAPSLGAGDEEPDRSVFPIDDLARPMFEACRNGLIWSSVAANPSARISLTVSSTAERASALRVSNKAVHDGASGVIPAVNEGRRDDPQSPRLPDLSVPHIYGAGANDSALDARRHREARFMAAPMRSTDRCRRDTFGPGTPLESGRGRPSDRRPADDRSPVPRLSPDGRRRTGRYQRSCTCRRR